MEDVSNTPVQSPTNLASSLRSDNNSAVGRLLRRGLAGKTKLPASQSPSPVPVLAPTPTVDPSDVLEKVISEVEKQTENKPTAVAQPLQPQHPSVISQVIPQVIQQQVDQQTNTLNPVHSVSSSTSKESIDSATPDQVVVDAARGIQQVEQEPAPEISPEVESYIKRVEGHQETAPHEIVIADGSQTPPAQAQLPSQPVVVIPITPATEKEGEKKSPKFSVRWLVEWSRKIMKAFTGKVIYQQEEA